MSESANKLMSTGKNDKLAKTDVKGDTRNDSTEHNLDIDTIFKMMDLYFSRKGVMYSHLYNSFNKFVEDLRNILKYSDNVFFEKITKDKIIRYKFEYENVAIRPPMLDNEDELMFPSDARDRNLTYSSKLTATVTQIQEIVDIATDEVTRKVCGVKQDDVPIAIIPIMLRSRFCSLNIKKGYNKAECDYDPGAYFIVNGSEKVVLSLERKCENKTLIFVKKDANALIYTAQVDSKSSQTNGLTQIITLRMKKDKENLITIRVPIISEVPVFILFRALGIESDKAIMDMIVYDDKDTDMTNLVRLALENSKQDKNKLILKQDDAIEYLITKFRVIKKYTETDKVIKQQQKRLHLLTLLEDKFLPHVTGGKVYKAFYLGYMINKLLQVYLGRAKPDDRDSFANKRIDLPGNLIEELFRQFYRKMLTECNKFYRKRSKDSDDNPLVIIGQIKPNIIEQGLKAALLTGSWGKKKGVAQMLQRLTYLQTLSFLRRVDAPNVDASTAKLTSPRHYHTSSTGMLCPVETPEHAKVGLVKHLTLISSITVDINSQIPIIKNIVKGKIIDLMDIPPHLLKEYTKVFINGEWVGMNNTPFDLVEDLRSEKLRGGLDMTVSICHNIVNREIKVYSGGGRLFRPVLRVNNNQIQITKSDIDKTSLNKTHQDKITSWDQFLLKNPGKIEYIDVEEQELALIAPTTDDVVKMRNRMLRARELARNQKTFDRVVNRYDDMQYVKYSYSEIHPSFLLGVIATNIPVLSHNQGPRNIFQYSQGRQAMGIYASNYRDRLDISYILYHPQRPLIATRTLKYSFSDVLTCGENVVVAIATYTGYNQEDSLVFNKSAINRGLFRSTSLKKFMQAIQKNQTTLNWGWKVL